MEIQFDLGFLKGKGNAKELDMETQAGKFPPVLLWAAGVALILFCAAGIAAFMGWVPTSMGGISDSVMPKHSANTSRPVARTAPARAKCAECGVVESMREIDVRGEGTGLGAVGGAVVGGVLGHQVGSGRGRTAATVVGAGAGAYAGNEIEKNAKKSTRYQVRVRMNDGSYRTFHENAQPALAIGQKVRVTEQGIVSAS